MGHISRRTERFFLANLMPTSIKEKIKEHLNETFKVFRRKGHFIWKAHVAESLQLGTPVSYNRNRRSEPTAYKNKNIYYNYNRNYQYHQQKFRQKFKLQSKLRKPT